MKKIFIAFTILSALFATSCGSAEKMAKQAENVLVSCNPSPLTVKGGEITADVTVKYPAKYFNSKAILEVTPVIVYEGGEKALTPLKYQGEKVKDNYKVVPSDGGTVSETFVFPYVEGMAKSHLELRGRCTTNNAKKWVTLPTKKVADGCNITELLACRKGAYTLKESGYQAIITSAPEGQLMYQINSSNVRNSEIKGQSIKDFKESLREANENGRKEIKNIEVIAYASPEGPEDRNIKLSEDRSKSAKKAFDKVVKKEKGLKDEDINTIVKSAGEDWEGFKALVESSNVQDKDLILRVLSMYNDSNVREKEIRNMSSIFQDLAKEVLPQLRRARIIANVEYTNYSDEELQTLLKDDENALDEPALLKVATLVKDNAAKMSVYNSAISRFNSAKAQYNLACVALDDEKLDMAKAAIAKCDKNDADVKNIEGVIALREGDIAKAKACFKAAGTADATKNLGTCALIEGNYKEAVEKCGGKCVNSAIANLMLGNAEAAMSCVPDCDCAKANYVRAICLNRMGKITEAKEALKKATDAKACLAKRAGTDIEFANLK